MVIPENGEETIFHVSGGELVHKGVDKVYVHVLVPSKS
ncbi:hypothetical protein JCM19275_2084 [Nonlabens ulvanivorans]|uniref:Uncharacterized protein n=1 Tax=Nonlabens ulvanivorans TaxID=906888 RepID=A0A090WKK2_NONUL|nr:hypothetical protein JCM19275_2084 [Nonlabens ulvanivorans]